MTNELSWPASPTTQVKRQAAQRAEQIRLGLQATAVLYAKAVIERDWQVLGYRSLTAWAAGEFGPDRFSPQRRKEIVALLSAAGYTQRAIAAAARTSPATVMRDQQQAAGASLETPEADNLPLAPRQRAARDREAARRAREEAEGQEATLTRRAQEEIARGEVVRGTEAVRALHPGRGSLAGAITESGDADEAVAATFGTAPARPPSAPQRQLSDAQIEEIIAGDLGRGQIVARFGVGEHAAQLARVAASAVMGERRRVANLVADLRKEADAYLEFRRGTHPAETVDTDRVKIKQFLDWLAQRSHYSS